MLTDNHVTKMTLEDRHSNGRACLVQLIVHPAGYFWEDSRLKPKQQEPKARPCEPCLVANRELIFHHHIVNANITELVMLIVLCEKETEIVSDKALKSLQTGEKSRKN